MLDFMEVSEEVDKRGKTILKPEFLMEKTEDLMTRGSDFYAIWVEDRGLWSKDEQDAIHLIDREIRNYAEANKSKFENGHKLLLMRYSSSGQINRFHSYCQDQLRDNYHTLDEKLIFSNQEVKKEDYVTKKLSYPLEKGSIENYDNLMNVLYSPEEREKIEWAIGSIVTGESRKNQKFVVLYGAPKTGKSTVLNIIEKLFEGYCVPFDAKTLGSTGSQFPLQAFLSDPLVAIQHDGDLSRIEDNTRLNSLVSHEAMLVNPKNKSAYSARFKTFLFMGTNKPVKITDAKSGLIRRLIDVSPTGNTIDPKEYREMMRKINFELGAIAWHCQEVYINNRTKYDDYIPVAMLDASNDFYNFMMDSYYTFAENDSTTLKAAWEMYQVYNEDAKVQYPLPQRLFKEELKNYFREYHERYPYGNRPRRYYCGFLKDKFNTWKQKTEDEQADISSWIELKEQESIFDKDFASCPAQYATKDETPSYKWDGVATKLSEIDTKKLHYVRVPQSLIVIDFDIPDKDGNKSLDINLKEASKWPKTYCEVSKSGKAVHLHYIYTGDTERLSRVYDEHIEVKVFAGKSSLRRKLTLCNDIPIAKISSGLPIKEEVKIVSDKVINDEKQLRLMIMRSLNKEYEPHATKPSIDFIAMILDKAHDSGIHYDVSDMYDAILNFAANSTHQKKYCLAKVLQMKLTSEEAADPVPAKKEDGEIIFFDIEVFPNLLLVNWKFAGPDQKVVRMINPSSSDIEDLLQFKLIGFNNRQYDNHILYARLIGYSIPQIFELSKNIVSSEKGKAEKSKYLFREAYNLSYADVFDFVSVKQSLKKYEIELDFHHAELKYAWDEPIPEEKWYEVAEYCDNDVLATEAVFNARKGDFMARLTLSEITGMTPNDTSNSQTTRMIFEKERYPQDQFNYRNLALPVPYTEYEVYKKKFGEDYIFRIFDENGLPTYQTYTGGELPDGWSILPFFPGYIFENGKSTYLGETIGEGGRVYSEEGMYSDVWDGDVTSMHPNSIIAERLFGEKYTKRFAEIVEMRIAIKKKDFDKARHMLNGALSKYFDDETKAGELASAFKIVINSIYGLTSASFENPFKDPRNVDNIVAKRGALFMTLLKQEVQKRGYKVCHIKTDSIKIPNADEDIKDFVIKFGKEFGYSFETEADFEKFCIVNDAVYVAKKKSGEWTATGTQFQIPYVFKKLFSKEDILFKDMCETKSVTTSMYLDMNESLPEGEHDRVFIGKVGEFCPIKPGCGGGSLMRESSSVNENGEHSYSFVTGTKGYRWMESETVKKFEKENDIDRSYYDKLVDQAVADISKYGDFEWFSE